MTKYLVDETYIHKYRPQIERGEPVNLEIRDVANVSWLGVKAIISPNELPGTEKVSVYNFVGSSHTGQEYYINILEELPEEADLPTARETSADGRVKL